eukprot:1150811-Pelagomonas_calceolata.AAC.3
MALGQVACSPSNWHERRCPLTVCMLCSSPCRPEPPSPFMDRCSFVDVAVEVAWASVVKQGRGCNGLHVGLSFRAMMIHPGLPSYFTTNALHPSMIH